MKKNLQKNKIISEKVLAKYFGKRRAAWLCQLHFWYGKMGGVEHEGRHYIWKTIKDMVELTGFSKNTCCRIQADFEALEFITVRRLGKGDLARTNFFAINYDVIASFFEKEMGQSGAKNGSIINTNMYSDNTVSDNTLITNSDKNPISDPIKNKSIPTQLVDEWNEMSEVKVSLTREIAIFLMAALKRVFGGCKRKMVDYFRSLHEKKSATFKPQLRWALSFKTINRVIGSIPQPDVMVLFKPPTTDLGHWALMKLGMEKFISFVQDLIVVDGEFDFCGNNFLRERVERLLL